MSTELKELEKEVKAIQKEIAQLGAMRPGSVSCQYRKPKTKEQPFWQISFSHHGKGRSEYIRPENLAAIKEETQRFARFKELVEKLTDASLQASRLRHAKERKRS